jgi:hypothetical protein
VRSLHSKQNNSILWENKSMNISFTKTYGWMAVGAVACSFLFTLFAAPTLSHAAITQKTGTTTSSLLAWWTFDEGTSTTASDYSGNRNTATLEGSPAWVFGKRGGALSFNGASTDVYISTGSSGINSPTNLTMSAWVKLASSQPTPTGILTKEQGDCTNSSYAFEINGFTPTFIVESTGSVRDAADGTALPIGQWKLLTGVYDGSTAKMYVDGVLINTTSHVQGIKSTTGTFQIGRQKFCSPVRFFNGSIDDVRLYSQALSAAEVFVLYRAGEVVRKVPNKTGLVGWWPLDEATSTTVADFSGLSNNGSFSGSPTWVTGKKGTALQFSGSSQSVNSIGTNSFPTGTNPVSMFAWVKTTSTARESALSYGNSATGQAATLNVNQLTTNGRFVVDFYNTYADSGVSVNDGRWHHVGFSTLGNTTAVTMYVDGVAYAGTLSGGAPNIAAGTNAQIGRWITAGAGDTGGYYFNGSIDDPRIYNRVVTASEVQALYKQNQTKVNAPQDNKLTNGLVGYWTFNGKDVGTTIADISGSNNHGYFSGGATSSALTIGKVGQGIKFDGINDFVRVLDPVSGVLDFGPNQSFSVAYWRKPDGVGSESSQKVFSKKGTVDNNSAGYGVYGQNCFKIGDGTNNLYEQCFGSGTTGDWNHTAFTVTRSGNCVGYLNGVAVSTLSCAGWTATDISNSSDLCIGANVCANGWSTTPVDEFRIYNRALTVAEVKQLYLMGK